MGIERGIIKPVVKFAAPIAIILAELASGCKSGSKAVQPAVKESPFTPTAITQECDPETYAQQLRLRGIPTPVGVGGGETGKEEEKFKEIMRITREMNICGTVTTADGQTVVDWNLAHSQKGEVPTPQATPATVQAKQTPTPEATKTPEVKKCLVLDDCSKVEFFVKANAAGVDVLYAGANLEPGTLLYARRDGQRGAIDLSESSPLKGTRITVRDPNLNDPEGVDYITGDIIPVHYESLAKDYNSINVNRGYVIGKIGNSGVKNDGYNHIHYIGKLDPQTGKAIAGTEELKQAYGYTPEQPVTIKRVPADASQSPFTSGPPVYK